MSCVFAAGVLCDSEGGRICACRFLAGVEQAGGIELHSRVALSQASSDLVWLAVQQREREELG